MPIEEGEMKMIDDRGFQLDLEEKEKDPLGRFEIMAEQYMTGSEKQREIILSFFQDPVERKTLLEGFGLYHLFRDKRLYDAMKKAVGEQLWQDFHQEPEPKKAGTWQYVRLNYPKEAGPLELITVSHRNPNKNFTGYRDDPRILDAVKKKDAGECEFLVWREVVKEEDDG